jgi:hypothetical protein
MERLHKHSEIYIQFALDNQEYYDIMFIMRSLALRIKENKEWVAGSRAYEVLRQNVKDCMDTGYFKGQHLEVVTFSLWAYVHGISSLVIRGRFMMVPEEYLDKIIIGSRIFITDLAKLTKN